jgi:hypothetical protein
MHASEVRQWVRTGSGNCDAVLAAPFSSAELLRLLSREHPAQAASEIELFHVEDKPPITCDGRTP